MEASSSNRRRPDESVDSRIVGALERLSQAFRTMLWEKAKSSPLGLTLSPIQIQVLVYLRRHEESRASLLADEFDVTGATVSEVLRSLSDKGLVSRERSRDDARVQVLRLTPLGEKAAEEVSDWAAVLEQHLHAHSDAEKVIVMRFLLDLIQDLHRAGLITVSRMCSTCRYFGRDESGIPETPHYCGLMEQPLGDGDLRLDCEEHVGR